LGGADRKRQQVTLDELDKAARTKLDRASTEQDARDVQTKVASLLVLRLCDDPALETPFRALITEFRVEPRYLQARVRDVTALTSATAWQ